MLRSGTSVISTLDPKEEFLKNWKIKETEIQKDSLLGEGGWAKVYKVLLYLCGVPFR
jgi:hypothetical protein